MKITPFLLLFSLFSFSALAMDYHTNTVIFTVNGNNNNTYITAGSYTVNTGDALSITDGQDPKNDNYPGMVVTMPMVPASLSFEVGRKGSGQVADWFASHIASNQNTFNHNPDDLNFAFLGALRFSFATGKSYTFNDIALAQGHTENGANNWWFGGKNCGYLQGAAIPGHWGQYYDTNLVRCTGTDQYGQAVWADFMRGGAGPISPEGNEDNIVTIESISVPDNSTVAISLPTNNSWLTPGSTTLSGTVTPVSIPRVQCYVDNQPSGAVANVSDNGTWSCNVAINTTGKHTVTAKSTQPLPLEKDASRTYMVASPLTITAPDDNQLVLPPVTLEGKQQGGATVAYESDHCGSGTATSNGNTWTTPPLSATGLCTFSFNQTWQGMTSPPVTRTLTLAAVPHITDPAESVPEGTRYPISGTGEPGATVDISLDDGWYPIDSVAVDATGHWSVQNYGPSSGSGEYTLTVSQAKNDQILGSQEVTLTVTDEQTTPAALKNKEKQK